MVGNAIAQSAQPIISYNFGLGYQSRVVATERIALLTSVACGVIIMTAFCLFPHILVGLFISPDNPAARLAIAGYPYFSAAFIFFILNLTVIGYYQSVERVKPATVLALLRGFVFLIPSFIAGPLPVRDADHRSDCRDVQQGGAEGLFATKDRISEIMR